MCAGALDAVREALSELSRLAATELETAGHNASPGAMRAVTATLEALSAYGTADYAPRAGRLVDEVDPPGFETLAALVPNAAGSSGNTLPSRVLQFQQQAAAPKRKAGEDKEERREEERPRETRRGESRRAGRRQEPARGAHRGTGGRRPRSRKRPANAKDTEQAMIEAEQVLDKIAKEAHTARQLARRLAAEAEGCGSGS
jgi:hypothetical protein